MKKLVLMIAAVAAMTFVACDQKKAENATEDATATDTVAAVVEDVADSAAVAVEEVADSAAAAVEEVADAAAEAVEEAAAEATEEAPAAEETPAE